MKAAPKTFDPPRYFFSKNFGWEAGKPQVAFRLFAAFIVLLLTASSADGWLDSRSSSFFARSPDSSSFASAMSLEMTLGAMAFSERPL